MATDGEYESVLCVKQDISVYKIPPRASNRGYRASDWKLEQPDWTGRLRITARGKVAYIKLEDKASGELFAQAPVSEFPGINVETVSDSSRYFVIRIQDGNGRSAFIGIGFNDRGDAFDFNVSLQDHFKWVKQENEISKESQNKDAGPKLDLGFKEGQTITLNIGQTKRRDGKPRPQGSVGFALLPPPPGGKIALPSSSESPNNVPEPVALNNAPQVAAEDTGSLLDLDAPGSVPSVLAQSDKWGDFSAPASSVPAQNQQSTNWVQF
ncbi:adaptin ear-binding coat-associated protein 1-like isoform X1 [Polyodon spathula]|uniref:adaptin ear-binding coat-associated protein 1-like isoform X1 n=1 Tax=Polyodon spathula TaxID=7913 RepID=UPI001B7E3142|nr:adaptin ear-binding coat-associated protein 1-like isoform X1 [Polyodon spathula]